METNDRGGCDSNLVERQTSISNFKKISQKENQSRGCDPPDSTVAKRQAPSGGRGDHRRQNTMETPRKRENPFFWRNPRRSTSCPFSRVLLLFPPLPPPPSAYPPARYNIQPAERRGNPEEGLGGIESGDVIGVQESGERGEIADCTLMPVDTGQPGKARPGKGSRVGLSVLSRDRGRHLSPLPLPSPVGRKGKKWLFRERE